MVGRFDGLCSTCEDTGHVCENHPDKPWHKHYDCGAGMPCPSCTEEIPMDGTRSITEAFTPVKGILDA